MQTSTEFSQVCLARERKGKLLFNRTLRIEGLGEDFFVEFMLPLLFKKRKY